MTKEELLADGWEDNGSVGIFNLLQYTKTINGYYYTLTCVGDIPEEHRLNILYDWVLHIDDDKYQTICSCEVDSLKHIELLSKIYNHN